MTTLIKQKLHESIGSIASNPNQPRNDLARFAGLWTQAQLREFQAATKPFSRVDKKLWR